GGMPRGMPGYMMQGQRMPPGPGGMPMGFLGQAGQMYPASMQMMPPSNHPMQPMQPPMSGYADFASGGPMPANGGPAPGGGGGNGGGGQNAAEPDQSNIGGPAGMSG
ncbi:hypothetical protein KEM52_003014, partial [Ascosphaera acerosa]